LSSLIFVANFSDSPCSSFCSPPQSQDRFRDLYFEVYCRPVGDLLPGHGCDGIVNLCQEDVRVPDTCKEDAFEPVIESSRVEELCGSSRYIFNNAAEAEACVLSHVSAADDCYPVSVTASTGGGQPSSTCGLVHVISVTATEEKVGDNDCGKSSTAAYQVLVDSSAVAACKVSPERVFG